MFPFKKISIFLLKLFPHYFKFLFSLSSLKFSDWLCLSSKYIKGGFCITKHPAMAWLIASTPKSSESKAFYGSLFLIQELIRGNRTLKIFLCAPGHAALLDEFHHLEIGQLPPSHWLTCKVKEAFEIQVVCRCSFLVMKSSWERHSSSYPL